MFMDTSSRQFMCTLINGFSFPRHLHLQFHTIGGKVDAVVIEISSVSIVFFEQRNDGEYEAVSHR
ncbi:hypothetical protein RYX36_034642 [Vicia faba]